MIQYSDMVDISLIAETLRFVGELTIAISVVRVHTHLLKEHRLDRDVYSIIRKEKVFVLLGVIALFIGFILQITLI